MATIVVDLDGVCYEYDRTAQYMLRTYQNEAIHRPSETWDWVQENVKPESWDWLWDEGVKRGLFRYGHVVKDTRWGMERLADLGYTFIIATHRPENARKDTMAWLELFFNELPIEQVRLSQESKHLIDGDFLIDDKPENIVQWNKYHGADTGLLFNRPHNWRGDKDYILQRVFGWKGVVAYLEGYV